ncbi:AAA family ATPase [Ruegeria sp.]|uniref:AAA family ATPase n=1 Tax=Ruegeria sp. TaxID=1879320 RepID=UPI003C7D50AE
MPESQSPQCKNLPNIKVKNFGPIANGEVTLRPLTVFMGPSNTGKSWLATLLYSLQQRQKKFAQSYFYGLFEIATNEVDKVVKFPENPSYWLKKIDSDSVIKLSTSEKNVIKKFLEYESDLIKDEMLRCFGLSSYEYLIRENTKKSIIEFNSIDNYIFGNYSSILKINSTTTNYFVNPPNCINLSEAKKNYEYNIFRKRILSSSEDNHIDTLQLFGELILNRNHLRHPKNQSAWYLPADRGGIMHAHQAVVSALIQNASRAGIRKQSSIPVLSGILSDFLENLISLAQDHRAYSPRHKGGGHAETLEKNILGGLVNIDQTDTNYPRFSWKPYKWKRSLPLLSASSMVSELAPLALYLRHLVTEGDLLILEEPEAHLHPSKQVELINEVATWVQAGIQVVLTTHSEWVLEQLSNIVGASKSKKNISLNTNQVGLWQFQSQNGSGSEIREVKWDDEGGYTSGFESVADDLHNYWVKLVEGGDD